MPFPPSPRASHAPSVRSPSDLDLAAEAGRAVVALGLAAAAAPSSSAADLLRMAEDRMKARHEAFARGETWESLAASGDGAAALVVEYQRRAVAVR